MSAISSSTAVTLFHHPDASPVVSARTGITAQSQRMHPRGYGLRLRCVRMLLPDPELAVQVALVELQGGGSLFTMHSDGSMHRMVWPCSGSEGAAATASPVPGRSTRVVAAGDALDMGAPQAALGVGPSLLAVCGSTGKVGCVHNFTQAQAFSAASCAACPMPS